MKRFNLLLPPETYEFLQTRSQRAGLKKSEYVRELIAKAIREGSITNINPKTRKSSSKSLSFNLKLNNEQSEWLTKQAWQVSCKKGDIIRYLIFLDRQKLPQKLTILPNDEPYLDPIILHINHLLKTKNYQQLNNYLYNLGWNKIINFGEHEFFIKAIDELIKNYTYYKVELDFLKSKLLWFCGLAYEAIDNLNLIKSRFNNKTIEVRADIMIAEIIIEIGIGGKAAQIFENISMDSINKESEWYKTKFFIKYGLSLYYTDDLDKISKYYETALKLSTRNETKAISHRFLGCIYHSMGQLTLSRNHFEKAMKLYTITDNVDQYMILLNTYSQLEITEMNWKEAEKMINESIEIAQRIKHVPNQIWGLRILADITFNLGNYEDSLKSTNKAIQLSEKIQNIKHSGKSYYRLAKILIQQKKYKDALIALEKSRILEKKRVGKTSTFNTVLKWQNYLKFITGESVNFEEMHKQTRMFNSASQLTAGLKNDYILGYIYLQLQDQSMKDKGYTIMRQLHSNTLDSQNRLLQFAVESTLRFNQLFIL